MPSYDGMTKLILSLQRMATEKAMMPETLAASILHKYVTGQLVASSKPL